MDDFIYFLFTIGYPHMENLWVTNILNFSVAKKSLNCGEPMGNFRCSISFLCHRLPILGKSLGLLPIGFPHIGKHMGTNTNQCSIGFPEVKIALP